MGWEDGNYRYTLGTLKDISRCYNRIYQGLEFSHRGWVYHVEFNPFRIAEFKADFDRVLKRMPGNLRRVVRKDIRGETTNSLLQQAHNRMLIILNGK